MSTGLKSLVDVLRDRVKNPIVPTFVLSWTVANWDKVFLLVAGTGTGPERVAAFKVSLLKLAWTGWLGLALLVPLGVTFLYLRFMPELVLRVQRMQRGPLEQQRDEKLDSQIASEDKKTILAQKRSQRFRLEAEAEALAAVSDLTDRVNQIDEQMKTVQSQANAVTSLEIERRLAEFEEQIGTVQSQAGAVDGPEIERCLASIEAPAGCPGSRRPSRRRSLSCPSGSRRWNPASRRSNRP
jgi:hypothetical protein